MSDVIIEVEPRDTLGKNGCRRMRRQGQIPAVLYGAGKPVVPVSVNPKELTAILHSEAGENTLLKLRLKGQGRERHAMIKDYQSDPVTGAVLHADFIRIEMDHKVTISVPVLIHGSAPGVREQGGILEVVNRELSVECLPADIPEHLDVDVSSLEIGHQIKVEEIDTAGRFAILHDLDTVVVSVLTPRKEEEEEAPVEAEEVEGAAAPAEGAGEAAGDEGEAKSEG